MDSNASPLLRLSYELRNLIYEYALTASSAIDLTGPTPALTRTSHQLREETLLLYYSLSKFLQRIPREQCPVRVERFAASHFCATPQGRKKLASIRHLDLEYHLSSKENQPVPSQEAPRAKWMVLGGVLARSGMMQDQIGWTAVSTSFDDPGLGWDYYMYLAESARLRLYQQMIVGDWEKISRRFCFDANDPSPEEFFATLGESSPVSRIS